MENILFKVFGGYTKHTVLFDGSKAHNSLLLTDKNIIFFRIPLVLDDHSVIDHQISSPLQLAGTMLSGLSKDIKSKLLERGNDFLQKNSIEEIKKMDTTTCIKYEDIDSCKLINTAGIEVKTKKGASISMLIMDKKDLGSMQSILEKRLGNRFEIKNQLFW